MYDRHCPEFRQCRQLLHSYGSAFKPAGIPLDALKDRMKTDEVTIDILRACMVVAFNRRTNQTHSGRRAVHVRPVRQDQGLGRLALEWLWTDDERWAEIMLSTDKLSKALCYYLCIGGLEEYVVGWITTAEITDRDGTLPVRVKYVWRGRLLRDLIGAKISQHWRTGNLDAALEYFVQISEQRHAALKLDPWMTILRGLSLWPAINLLMTTLEWGRRSASPDIYQRFKSSVFAMMTIDNFQGAYNRAILHLYDPTMPLPEHHFLHAKTLCAEGSPAESLTYEQRVAFKKSLSSGGPLAGQG